MTIQSYTTSSENNLFACSTAKMPKEIGMFFMEDTDEQAESFAQECIQDLEQLEQRLFGKDSTLRHLSRGCIQDLEQLEQQPFGKDSTDRHPGSNFHVFVDPEFRSHGQGNHWTNYWPRESQVTAAQNEDEDAMNDELGYEWGDEHEERFIFVEADTHREIRFSELFGSVGYSDEIEEGNRNRMSVNLPGVIL